MRRPVLWLALICHLVFALVFRPAMAAETVGDPHYASIVEGLRDGSSASRAVITALEPAQDAELVAPPTVRWRDRASGERAADAPESPPRRFTRQR